MTDGLQKKLLRCPKLRLGLLRWFGKHKRDLPWRRTKNPYKIWISEIMLQQTQVDTVIPYYRRWMMRFGDIESLARAPFDHVLKLWEGLGYYRRARHIHESARIIVEKYRGNFPSTFEEVIKLPGIGRYTAGAILSIAFGKPAPVLDGNVARVLSRIFKLRDPIDTGRGQKKLWELAARSVPVENPGDFNQALMELGATVCLPSDPLCPVCPTSGLCSAYRDRVQNQYPRKSRKTVSKKVRAVCAIVRRNGKILIAKRPDRGLWADLWEFPTFPVPKNGEPRLILVNVFKRFGMDITIEEKKADLKRSYTDHREDLEVYQCKLVNDRQQNRGQPAELPHSNGQAVKQPFPYYREQEKVGERKMRWAYPHELHRWAFPSAHAKIIRDHL